MIYLDSSAIMKLVREEDETPGLIAWLQRSPEAGVLTSELGCMEALRAARRAVDRALTEAQVVVADLDLIPLGRGVRDIACDIGDPSLRTLDALHLASAVLVRGAPTAFVASDHRLVSAAQSAGLPTVTPGRDR